MSYSNKFPVSKAGKNSSKVDSLLAAVSSEYASELKSQINIGNARRSMLQYKIDNAIAALNCNEDDIKIYIACTEEALAVLNCNNSVLKYYRNNDLIDWYINDGIKYYDLCSITHLEIPLPLVEEIPSKDSTNLKHHICDDSGGNPKLGNGIIKLLKSLQTKFSNNLNSTI